MKEIKTLELEQLRQHLEYRGDKTLRSLNPFFEVRLFELESSVSPFVIIAQAFSRAKPEKAQISGCSQNDFSNGITSFFSYLEGANQEQQFKVAYEFLEALKFTIKLEQSEIWEYVPDENCFDELYDYIGWGFTYVIIDDSKRRCLVVHGGYID